MPDLTMADLARLAELADGLATGAPWNTVPHGAAWPAPWGGAPAPDEARTILVEGLQSCEATFVAAVPALIATVRDLASAIVEAGQSHREIRRGDGAWESAMSCAWCGGLWGDHEPACVVLRARALVGEEGRR